MIKIHEVLLTQIISEKVMNAGANENAIGFWVNTRATKADIKKAVESLFKVTVLTVRTLNMRRRAVRFGRTEGFQKARKKAYVKLAEGQSITLAND